jgi:hypothetical protein
VPKRGPSSLAIALGVSLTAHAGLVYVAVETTIRQLMADIHQPPPRDRWGLPLTLAVLAAPDPSAAPIVIPTPEEPKPEPPREQPERPKPPETVPLAQALPPKPPDDPEFTLGRSDGTGNAKTASVLPGDEPQRAVHKSDGEQALLRRGSGGGAGMPQDAAAARPDQQGDARPLEPQASAMATASVADDAALPPLGVSTPAGETPDLPPRRKPAPEQPNPSESALEQPKTAGVPQPEGKPQPGREPTREGDPKQPLVEGARPSPQTDPRQTVARPSTDRPAGEVTDSVPSPVTDPTQTKPQRPTDRQPRPGPDVRESPAADPNATTPAPEPPSYSVAGPTERPSPRPGNTNPTNPPDGDGTGVRTAAPRPPLPGVEAPAPMPPPPPLPPTGVENGNDAEAKPSPDVQPVGQPSLPAAGSPERSPVERNDQLASAAAAQRPGTGTPRTPSQGTAGRQPRPSGAPGVPSDALAPDNGFTDRDSDPFTSAEVAAVFTPGKVVPQRGRYFKLPKPRWTLATGPDAMSAVLKPPVTWAFRVETDTTGKVVGVRPLPGTGTGIDSIDRPVLLAMYEGWFEPPKDPLGRPRPDVFRFAIRLQ